MTKKRKGVKVGGIIPYKDTSRYNSIYPEFTSFISKKFDFHNITFSYYHDENTQEPLLRDIMEFRDAIGNQLFFNGSVVRVINIKDQRQYTWPFSPKIIIYTNKTGNVYFRFILYKTTCKFKELKPPDLMFDIVQETFTDNKGRYTNLYFTRMDRRFEYLQKAVDEYRKIYEKNVYMFSDLTGLPFNKR